MRLPPSGCLLVGSAAVVEAPLILPIAAVSGVAPSHLGVIILANLEFVILLVTYVPWVIIGV